MIAQRFAKPISSPAFIFAGQRRRKTSSFSPLTNPPASSHMCHLTHPGACLPEPADGWDGCSLALRVQQLEEEIRRLNGLVEEQAGLLTRLQDQSLERYVGVDRRLR